MKKQPSVAIIIPTYNEKENISLLINEIFHHQPTASIYVVDDQSPDNTAAVVRKMQSLHQNLFLISNSKKAGRGTAVMVGFKQAYKNKHDIFVEMDADFSHQPQELKVLIKQIKDNRFVIGSRYILGGKTHLRKIGSLTTLFAS